MYAWYLQCTVFYFSEAAFWRKMLNRITSCQMRNIYSSSSDFMKGSKCLSISLNTDRES